MSGATYDVDVELATQALLMDERDRDNPEIQKEAAEDYEARRRARTKSDHPLSEKRAKALKTDERQAHVIMGLILTGMGVLFWGLLLGLRGYMAADMCFHVVLPRYSTVLSMWIADLSEAGCFPATVAVGLAPLVAGLLYHLLVMYIRGVDQFVNLIVKDNVYSNGYRWGFRAVTWPLLLMPALYASGMRDLISFFLIIVMAAFAEVLKWVGERRSVMRWSKSRNRFERTVRAHGAFYASIVLTGIVILTPVLYLIISAVDNLENVGVFAWSYTILFLFFYLVHAVMVFALFLNDSPLSSARIMAENVWDGFDVFSYIVLTSLFVGLLLAYGQVF